MAIAASGPRGTGSKVGKPAAAVKPKLRGVSHVVASLVAITAGARLAGEAPTARRSWASLVFTSALVVQFAVSGVYHTITWSPTPRTWLKRADHAAIFVLIAGTYTPICLLALEGEVGNRLLLLVWTGALLGIGQSLFWVTLPKPLTACLYLALGWMAVTFRKEILERTGTDFRNLILAGGALYSVGAGAYVLKWPNPNPHIFGYHEVFHLFVILASATHFTAIRQLVLQS